MVSFLIGLMHSGGSEIQTATIPRLRYAPRRVSWLRPCCSCVIASRNESFTLFRQVVTPPSAW